jgi:hypothetical protein
MKSGHFKKTSLGCLLCLLIVIASANEDKTSTNRRSQAEKNISQKPSRSLQDPIEYVLGKLEDYDLVMIGEHHWTHEQPAFIENLIKRCYEEHAIDFLFLEFGEFQDQGKIDIFLESKEYDPQPVVEVLRNSTDMGWGYQEYFDIFKTIYFENKERPESRRIKIIMVDGPPSTVNMDEELYNCLEESSWSEKEKRQKVCWIREGIAGRDSFMAEVIAAYMFDGSGRKGIYYAGGAHIRKDLREKSYGLRLFSAGGILVRKYPGRVCSLTFHKQRHHWQNLNDFEFLEQRYEKHAKSFAVDTASAMTSHLKLKSKVSDQSVTLNEAFDGYIMLNLDKDYHPCSLVSGFYDDAFAEVVWARLRKDGTLDRLPPEWSRWREKTPTGEELAKMIGDGLR